MYCLESRMLLPININRIEIFTPWKLTTYKNRVITFIQGIRFTRSYECMEVHKFLKIEITFPEKA